MTKLAEYDIEVVEPSSLTHGIGLVIERVQGVPCDDGVVRMRLTFTDGSTAMFPLPDKAGGTWFGCYAKLQVGKTVSFAKLPNPRFVPGSTDPRTKYKFDQLIVAGAVDLTQTASSDECPF